MSTVKLYNRTGDEKAQNAQANIEKGLGFIPETYQAMGRSGAFLNSVLQLDQAAGANLDEKTRQLIMIAVSAANGCGYCVDAHHALGLKAGLTDEEISGAVEIAAMMSAYNTFNKALGLNHDVNASALGLTVG